MTTSPSPPAALGPLGLWTPFELADRRSEAEEGGRGRARAVLVSADRARLSGEARVGTVFAGDWEIKRRLGSGGMGEVFEALYRRDRQRYALKILAGEHAGQAGMVERFRHEYLALTKMSHPGIVRAHFSGAWEGEEWYSMELLRGASLEEVCRRGPLGAAEVLAIGIELCEALEALHAHGVIHRDLKPANVVMLAEPSGGRRVKLLDLGVAKLMPAFYADGEAATPPEARIQTQAGAPLGTPGYMAPEVFRGATAAVGQDVFGLGVTLFRAATGRMPYASGRAGLEAEPRWSHEMGRSMVVGLEIVLRRALAADPAVRFQSIASFRDELERVREELEAEEGAAVGASARARTGGEGAAGTGAGRVEGARSVTREPGRPRGLGIFVAGLVAGALCTLGVQSAMGPAEVEGAEVAGAAVAGDGSGGTTVREAPEGGVVGGGGIGDEVRVRPSSTVAAVGSGAGIDDEVHARPPSTVAAEIGGVVVGVVGGEGGVEGGVVGEGVAAVGSERVEGGGGKARDRGRAARDRAVAAWVAENRARLVGCLPWGSDPAEVEVVITIGGGGEVEAVELGGGRWPGMSEECVGRLLRGLKTPSGGRSTTHRAQLGGSL